jgi:putative SOS response-associated peptidase YedK
MCGRYILAQQARAATELGVQKLHWLDMSSYNIAPAREVPVIRMSAGDIGERQRLGVMMRWGLIPSFLKGEPPKYSTINARMETMQASPAFREPWKKAQRCIVPADGFYEWHQPVGRPKQPWFIGQADKEILAFAGLWDRSKRSDGVVIESFAIITLPANELMSKIDNEDKRMPAIVRTEHLDTWLAGSLEDARAVLLPYPGEKLRAFKVSARVNSLRNDDATLLEEQGNVGE